MDAVEASVGKLRKRALATLRSAGLAAEEIEFDYALDMRYRGQGYDVTVPLDLSTNLDPGGLEAAFEVAYRHRYGVRHQGQVEVRACRLQARGPEPEVMVRAPAADGSAGRTPRRRRVWFDEGDDWLETGVIRFDELRQGERLGGPLVIEADHTSYVVGPSGAVSLTENGELVMEVPSGATSDPRSASAEDLEIVIARLRAIADEADRALLRTAFSSVVRDAKDYSLVITDPQGRCLALPTECMPLFVTSMPRTIRLLAEQFPPATLNPGDILITNDPWLCAGHKSDLVLVAPVFRQDEVVAFVGTILHVADIGGTLGDFRAWDIFEEGLALPPLKLYQGGDVNQGVESVLLANVRVPEQVRGDIAAMRAAIEVASRRLRALFEEVQLDLDAVAREVGTRAQEAVRRHLEALPPGVFGAELKVDGAPGDDPGSYPPVHLQLRASVAEGELLLDFTGTDPQQPRKAINVPLSYTVSDAIYAVQYLFRPDIPNIGPQFSPVRVRAPEGSILNARPPVPVFARTRTGLHIGSLFNAALATALPEQVQAGSGHTFILTVAGRHDDGDFFQVTLMPKGGMGAGGDQDGWNCTVFPTNSTMISTEVAEGLCPILIDRKFRRDSGGAGRQRGGVGQVITIESLADHPLILAFRPNFVSHPPVGLLGGHPGAGTRIEIDGHPPRENPTMLQPGGVLRVWTAGGGGIGEPLERDAERVLADVSAGLVSSEQARKVYGVVVDSASGHIDALKTAAERLHRAR